MNDFLIPEWLREFDENSQKEIAVLNTWNGLITQYLTPLSDNEAALSWNFDPLHKNIHELIVKLTDDEANTVFNSNVLTGMIEDIRQTMTYPESIIRITDKKNSQIIAQINYTIDKTITEKEFSNNLDKEVENIL